MGFYNHTRCLIRSAQNTRTGSSVVSLIFARKYVVLTKTRNSKILSPVLVINPQRNIYLVGRLVRGVLKIRYLVLGGAVGGSVQLSRKYEEWKEKLPDFSWIHDALPSDESAKKFRESMIEFGDASSKSATSVFANVASWFNSINFHADPSSSGLNSELSAPSSYSSPSIFGSGSGDDDTAPKTPHADRLQRLQDELIQIQMKYQREIERLEKENKELRKQVMLKSIKAGPRRNLKKSLIDLYSEVLDELSDYDTTYNVQDHLPRVVVVGDQSAGKTSVLEMIAGARIFPRGAGEMMTRAPVKVTLAEGPYHIATFKDSSREFDLTKESDLVDLRREVELRMKNSVSDGRSVSSEVISMTVKGPGLQRMVLVDLPGIISTATTEMADGTKDTIREMTQLYMNNPNAIILCIQDGSVDAERSMVTDLVSSCDPTGKRTIFVLTKVDLAEQNMANPTRIRKILDGKLFPMKALGYFAVVTGRGSANDSIQVIRDYEEKFFMTSKLCREGILNMSQCTTQSLSFAVSECFWKMVKESVEQQADTFKAQRYNLETEWKNSFPRLRELDRDELFEKARGELLDEVVNLSQLSPKHWEEALGKKLWESMANYVCDSIYFPAAQTNDPGHYNTAIDIRLKLWTEKLLPSKSVEIAWLTLQEEFQHLLTRRKQMRDHDTVFDKLHDAVFNEVVQRHSWEDKAIDTLRLIQMNALEDRVVHDKHHWDNAVRFLEDALKQKKEVAEARLNDLIGPGWWEQWTHWKYANEEQHKHAAVRSELMQLLKSDSVHPAHLTQDELTAVRKNLQTKEIDVDYRFIKDTWEPVYRLHFIDHSLRKARECRKCFYLYQQGNLSDSGVECSDVVLFWRIQRMMQTTANVLRQQVMNREARRLEKEVKEVLDDFVQDTKRKQQLLTGRRVELAEELKRVRQIQEKLEEFVAALNNEK